MNRRIGALAVRSGLLALALCAVVPQAALATTTSVGVFASYGNASPGIRRNTNGTGPLTDTAADVSGGNFATAFASVDTFGLHAAATATSATPFRTAQASASAGLVNSFTIVPRAGFTGTTALVQVPYSFGGSFMSHPSLAACATCFAVVDARLEVDGLVGQGLFYVGAHSQGTMGNANFVAGGVVRSGVLQGLLPVNTPLFLRASLTTNAHCQMDSATPCGIESLFAGALSYTGFSPDDVDIVWGLVPTLVPEPTSSALLGLCLLALLPRVLRRA